MFDSTKQSAGASNIQAGKSGGDATANGGFAAGASVGVATSAGLLSGDSNARAGNLTAGDGGRAGTGGAVTDNSSIGSINIRS